MRSKRVPKTMPKYDRKSIISVERSLLVVLSESSLYYSKTIVWEESRFEELKEVQEKNMRKEDPEEACGIKRKRGIKWRPNGI